MTSVREAIKEQNRLARMRAGQLAPEYVDIPSKPGVRVALVPLTEYEAKMGLIEASKLMVGENMAGIQLQNRVTTNTDVWNACREMDDPTQKVWRTVEEMENDIDPADIDYLSMNLTVLMDYASPSLANLSDDEVEALKKAWQMIPWRELTGLQAAAARVFLSTVLRQALPDNSFGSTSIGSSTLTTESDESISGASPSTETTSEPARSAESLSTS